MLLFRVFGVGNSCFLGMEVCDEASKADLTQGHGVFKLEFEILYAGYKFLSVNTGGWLATQKTWQNLFTTINVIECFL